MKPHSLGLDSTHVGAEYDQEQVEFLRAVDRRKTKLHRNLDARDILAVAHDLGYRRVTALECSACELRVELVVGQEWPRSCDRCGGMLLDPAA